MAFYISKEILDDGYERFKRFSEQHKKLECKRLWQVIRRFEYGAPLFAKGKDGMMYKINNPRSLVKAFEHNNVYIYKPSK